MARTHIGMNSDFGSSSVISCSTCSSVHSYPNEAEKLLKWSGFGVSLPERYLTSKNILENNLNTGLVKEHGNN